MTRWCRDCPVHVPLEWRLLVGHPTWCEIGLLVVSHPPEDGQRRQGTEASAASTQKQEETKVTTNLVIVERSRNRAEMGRRQ